MSIWDTWAADPRYAQLIKDPRYLQATPAFQKSISDLFFDAGIQPNAQQQADYGIGPVASNPYSSAAMLMRGRESADHQTYNAANAAGLEESGAAAGGLNANNEDYKRGYQGVVTGVGRGAADALLNYTGGMNTVWSDIINNPPVPPGPAPLTPSIGGEAGAPAPGGREIDRPGVQPNPWHIPTATGAPMSVANKLKKTAVGFSGRAL